MAAIFPLPHLNFYPAEIFTSTGLIEVTEMDMLDPVYFRYIVTSLDCRCFIVNLVKFGRCLLGLSKIIASPRPMDMFTEVAHQLETQGSKLVRGYEGAFVIYHALECCYTCQTKMLQVLNNLIRMLPMGIQLSWTDTHLSVYYYEPNSATSPLLTVIAGVFHSTAIMAHIPVYQVKLNFVNIPPSIIEIIKNYPLLPEFLTFMCHLIPFTQFVINDSNFEFNRLLNANNDIVAANYHAAILNLNLIPPELLVSAGTRVYIGGVENHLLNQTVRPNHQLRENVNQPPPPAQERMEDWDDRSTEADDDSDGPLDDSGVSDADTEMLEEDEFLQ